MVIGVPKEIKENEKYQYLRPQQILFAYLHLAPEFELTKTLLKKRVIGIAYETTIEGPHQNLPLLSPMSEVAGRTAVQVGAQLLEKHCRGKGVLLGGVPGVTPAQVVIIGEPGSVIVDVAIDPGGCIETIALTNATIEYALQLANKSFRRAVLENKNLAKGVNLFNGHVTYRAIAESLNLPYVSLEEAMRWLSTYYF